MSATNLAFQAYSRDYEAGRATVLRETLVADLETPVSAYLKLAGDVIGGDMLARQALATAVGDDEWSRSKAALARIYASQVLTQASGLADAVTEGGADLESLSASALGD